MYLLKQKSSDLYWFKDSNSENGNTWTSSIDKAARMSEAHANQIAKALGVESYAVVIKERVAQ